MSKKERTKGPAQSTKSVLIFPHRCPRAQPSRFNGLRAQAVSLRWGAPSTISHPTCAQPNPGGCGRRAAHGVGAAAHRIGAAAHGIGAAAQTDPARDPATKERPPVPRTTPAPRATHPDCRGWPRLPGKTPRGTAGSAARHPCRGGTRGALAAPMVPLQLSTSRPRNCRLTGRTRFYVACAARFAVAIAVVYWTNARIIINVRGSCALIGELGRYPKNKNHKHEKHTSTSTGLRQPRTQHDGGHGNMAHAHVARILGITTGRGRHAVLRKLVKKLGSVAHSGRAHRRGWHGAQRHRFQPRIKSRRCCASAARFKPIFKQTAACPDAERFLSELNKKKHGMGREPQKPRGMQLFCNTNRAYVICFINQIICFITHIIMPRYIL